MGHTLEIGLTCRSDVISVAELVALQASRRGDAIAVISPSGKLSYRELDERASALAAELRTFSVGPDVVVGLCAPRSISMVVGALGILKAGGAYLPLNPTYPPSRLLFILDDADVHLVVTTVGAKNRTPAARDTIILDEGGRVLERPPSPQPVREASPTSGKNLAYVIYTSGSTGQPKGVEIEHESLLNLVGWHQQAFGVTAADRASQIASVGFDAAVWETWPYLTAGACLYLPEEDTVSDPEALRDWLVRQNITISFAPTPMAEKLLALPWPAGTSLRTLLTGADTLNRYPTPALPFHLINNYGLSECAVVTTSGQIYPTAFENGIPPIGRPISNTKVYFLDETGRQVAPGKVGELHVGGIGLARGYRNSPKLTAEKFVPNPFSAGQGERLFKTGDLASLRPDGQIAFVGRLDGQIKVRGFRVEPNEVTAVLNQHPLIHESLVIASEVAPGDRRLRGYFVATPGSHPTSNELGDFLRERLPDFMVPLTFTGLEKLPLTPSGKIDRLSLPIAVATSANDNSHSAPQTDMEKTVAGLLAHLLKVESVQIDDNFFSLGGHSLLGAQLIARLRDRFGIEMPLRAVFEAPTVAELSTEIERLLAARVGPSSGKEVLRSLDSAKCSSQPA